MDILDKDSSDLNLAKNILQKGLKYHIDNDFLNAEKCYIEFINKGFNSPLVLSNYGIICFISGRISKAKELYLNSIKLFPHSPEAYSNLASILLDEGDCEKAEELLNKALKLKPQMYDALLNLGSVLLSEGKLDQSEEIIRKCFEVQPDNINSTLSLLYLLQKKFNSHEFLDQVLIALRKFPYCEKIYKLAIDFQFTNINSALQKKKLRELLIFLLKHKNIYHAKFKSNLNVLFSEELLKKIIYFEGNIFSSSQFSDFLEDEVFTLSLGTILLSQLTWELAIKRIRKDFLEFINSDLYENKHKDLISSLAKQCYLNDYAYSLVPDEIKLLENIKSKIKNDSIQEDLISIFACYKPLNDLFPDQDIWNNYQSDSDSFQELLSIQIYEPIEEKKLLKNIITKGRITDLSLLVKNQYEKNPYPKWRFTNYYSTYKDSLQSILNNDISPNKILSVKVSNPLRILVAGCGTGYQLIYTSRYKNCEITAIDLSRASLSYAKRKANEYGMNNVSFYEMDLLDIHLLNTTYDVILCSGVLHHMEDPDLGLKSLLKCLNINGFIQLALYSKYARKVIQESRKFINDNSILPSEENLRYFRELVISNENTQLQNLKDYGDFYSLSGLRDLCFHEQELIYTIPQIKELLNINHLNFLGFLLPQNIKNTYANIFPYDSKLTNLANWDVFEKQNPLTFKRMYQFWARKF